MNPTELLEIKREQTVKTLCELQKYFQENNLEIWMHKEGYIPENTKMVLNVFFRKLCKEQGLTRKTS